MLGVSEARVQSTKYGPGVYQISNLEYHGSEGLSSTHLKELLRSPAHYQAWLNSQKKDSEDMLIGRAAHCLVLEPDKFKTLYAVVPKCDKRTKEGKALWAQFQADNQGKELLTDWQCAVVEAVRDSLGQRILADKALSQLFLGLNEYSFYWTDEKTGLLCKVRPDCLSAVGIITDLKVTEDASEKNFSNQIARLMYFMSAAFYLDGVKECIRQCGLTDIPVPEGFVLAAVEKEAPNEIALYELDENALEFGRKQYRKALEVYAEANKTGNWAKGYPRQIQTIGLPNWAYYQY